MSDNPRQPAVTMPTPIERVLREMNRAGEFQASLLTSAEGLPIATAPANCDSDVTAAMVALVQRASYDAQSQLGMADVDEVTIRDRDRIRLVCRYIAVGSERLILATMVPPGHSYRRVTNLTVRRIRRLLS
jgi:predicted regulator of Ras-like GTPase activity (Roadblock/LC7/MglB family)